MGETCPKKTNRWLAFGSVLKFYITHALRIVVFLNERREQVGNAAPRFLTPSWWLLTYALAPVIAIIIETVVKLQARDLVICQQCQLLVLLANDIRDMFKVRHINDEADNALNDLPIADYVHRDNSFMLLVTLCEYVDNLRTRAQAHWLAINANEKTIVLETIAQFAISLLEDTIKVEAERDPANNAAIDLAPLVMPMDLVKMRSSTFIFEVIEPRKAQLQTTAWTDDQINAIENDHRNYSRRTAGRTTSRRSSTSTITRRHSMRHGTRSMACSSTSCVASAPGWQPSSPIRRRSSLTSRFLNGSLTNFARVCWTCLWMESSKQKSSRC
jgi:hypothetical protein